MPTTYQIDVDRQIILSSATGTLLDEDLRSHQRQVLADVDFDRSFDQLWDFRKVEQIDVATDTLRQLAEARSYAAGVKRAIVAPSDMGFGMARMFEMLHDDAPEEVRVFRALEDAERWLGLT
jgi:hypothetical protein